MTARIYNIKITRNGAIYRNMKKYLTAAFIMTLFLLSVLGINAYASEYINVTTDKNGEYDIYTVPNSVSSGYRYGPSFIVNEDKTIDAFFASSGSSTEQWDWIMYKHFDGKVWSEEKCVLQPTPNSFDRYSCCDPGVIYMGGYYYLTYTSTMNYDQTDNSLFVARSKEPDGPYEKWNGKGWGGFSPKPIVAFSQDPALWGIGEASMTELDGTLYLYYTESGTQGHSTALATADAGEENWPLTLKFRGCALENTSSDAIDVKYIEEYDRFIAVASDRRMTEESYLVFYESRDGLKFKISDICKKDVFAYCHNPGLSGDKRGHITKDMSCFVGYAYGEEWGVWNTRVLPFSLSLSGRAELSEQYAPARSPYPFARDTRDPASLDITGISPQTKCVIRSSSTAGKIKLSVNYCTTFRDKWKSISPFMDEVKMYGYDENVIKAIKGSMEFEVTGAGETMVTVELRGHITYVYIFVYDIAVMTETRSLLPAASTVFNIFDSSDGRDAHIKSVLYYNDGTMQYITDNEWQFLKYEYDPEELEIDEKGHIIPKKTGSFSIKVSKYDLYYTIKVNVTEALSDYKDFPDVRRTNWYYPGIRYCFERGYISGTDKGVFNPEGRLTREQFVVILARVDKADLSFFTVSPFRDVDAESWYGPSVIWAESGGYVNGIGEALFGVGRPMTRESIAVMLHRYSGDSSVYPSKLYSYHDWGNVSSWAADSVNWAVVKGILGSTDSSRPILSPKMTVTRAQAAKIFTSIDQI